MKRLLLPLLISTPLFAHQPIEEALCARQMAYAPYSNFCVGAAVVTKSGNIYRGCNIENASYGMTICAERTAVFKAVSEGDTEVEACYVVVPGGGTPCGGCRQVLNEFNPHMRIICIDEMGCVVQETTLDQLLPNAFGPHNLEK